jgi:hypothetical protein
MSTAVRNSLQIAEHTRKRVSLGVGRQVTAALDGEAARRRSERQKGEKPRVFVAAENRLLREALSRMLTKSGEIEVIGAELSESFQTRSAPGSGGHSAAVFEG